MGQRNNILRVVSKVSPLFSRVLLLLLTITTFGLVSACSLMGAVQKDDDNGSDVLDEDDDCGKLDGNVGFQRLFRDAAG